MLRGLIIIATRRHAPLARRTLSGGGGRDTRLQNKDDDAATALLGMFARPSTNPTFKLTRDDVERLGKLSCLDTSTMDDEFIESLNAVVDFCRLVERYDEGETEEVGPTRDDNRFRKDDAEIDPHDPAHADFERVKRMPTRFIEDHFVGPSTGVEEENEEAKEKKPAQ